MLYSIANRLLLRGKSVILRCQVFLSTENESALSTLQESLNCDTKVLKVAIIGMPNAGKSTLINGLMDRKVCAVSSKVHTTRTKAKAIFTFEDTQIIFMDTPGLVTDREHKRFNLQKTFIKDYKTVSQEADIIGVIHDISNIWTRDRLDIKVVNLLEKHKQKPSFLVLNKVDVLKSKRKLLDIVNNVTDSSLKGKPIESRRHFKKVDCEIKGWPYFTDIFMVSALTGDGIDDIKHYLVENARPGKWMFGEETWTDQAAESVVLNVVKAALLNHMPQEIPYKLVPIMEYFKINETTDKINVSVLIKCPTERIKRLVCGTSDGRLRLITETVQKDLQDCFHNFVKIQLVPVENKIK